MSALEVSCANSISNHTPATFVAGISAVHPILLCTRTSPLHGVRKAPVWSSSYQRIESNLVRDDENSCQWHWSSKDIRKSCNIATTVPRTETLPRAKSLIKTPPFGVLYYFLDLYISLYSFNTYCHTPVTWQSS